MVLITERSFDSFSVYPEIVVVGSANVDLNVCAPRFPLQGETIRGSNFSVNFGGKGLNQATQAALLYPNENFLRRKHVAFVCKIGKDENGRAIQQFLEEKSICTSNILVEGNTCTGVASITNTDEGENMIIIVGGANEKLLPNDVNEEKIKKVIQNAKIVLCQNEIPVETTLEVFRVAKGKDNSAANNDKMADIDIKHNINRHSGIVNEHPITVYTPSPVYLNVSKELYELTDVLCLNVVEASLLFESERNVNFLNNLSLPLSVEQIQLIKEWVHELATLNPKCSNENEEENKQHKESSSFSAFPQPSISAFPNLSYIVTLGKYGCCILDRMRSSSQPSEGNGNATLNTIMTADTKILMKNKINYIPAVNVSPEALVDTVGAGDSLCGALAFFLIKNFNVEEAVKRASLVASYSVKKKGAANSYYEHKNLSKELFQDIIFG